MNRRQLLIGGGAVALAGAGGAYAGWRRMGSMAAYDAAAAKMRTVLSANPEMRDFMRYATLAPNGHNSQPWQFRPRRDGIDILPDFTRRTPIVDPDDHHLLVSLGCAAENLVIAAGARGRPGTIGFDPADGGCVSFRFGAAPPADLAWFDAIARRQSTRGEFDGRPVAPGVLRKLADAARGDGVDLIVITDPPAIARIGDLVIAGNSAQMADSAFLRELKSWLRFSPRQAIETGDGLFTATTGNPILPALLGPLLFELTVSAKSENDKYARHMRSSSGIAVFAAERSDPDHWVRVGRACQRFALAATAQGLKLAFVNQPVEVASLRPEFAALVGLPGRRPDLVMRFGYGPAMPFSARRPPTVASA
jgi:nitroreductase